MTPYLRRNQRGQHRYDANISWCYGPVLSVRTLAGACLAAGVVCLAACQDESGPAPANTATESPSRDSETGVKFLEWNGTPPADQVVHSIEPKDGIEAWQIHADRFRLMPRGTAGDGQLFIFGEGNRALEIPVPDGVPMFNRVDVEFYCTNWAELQLIVRASQQEITTSDWIRVRTTEKEPVLLSFWALGAVSLQKRSIRLRFRGGPLSVSFAGAKLVHSSSSRCFSPAPDLPASVSTMGDARWSVGLSSRSPITTDLEWGAPGQLRFSCYFPPEFREVTDSLNLHLEVVRGGSSVASHEFPIEFMRRDGWTELEWDLPGTVQPGDRIRLRQEPAEGLDDVVCAIGDARIVRPQQDPKTILLITSDTHRADHVGYANSEVAVSTPAMDALAASGVAFQDCFASINNTNPSHIALMTGTHPRDTGIVDNLTSLTDRATTLAEIFRDNGYTTCAAVSAKHLGSTSGLRQGFSRFDFPHSIRDGGDTRDGGKTINTLQPWLSACRGEPLFVWLHLFDAHTPYEVPDSWQKVFWPEGTDPFDPTLPDLPEQQVPKDMPGLKDVRFPSAMYRAEVSCMDAELGRLLLWDRWRDAFITLTADHGESLGDHEVYWDHLTLYPDTIHVPLILVGPGIPAGQMINRPVRHIDIGRTLLDLAEISNSTFPGKNLFETDEEQPRFALQSHRFGISVQIGDWYLILNLRDQTKDRGGAAPHQVQLYHLAVDPKCLVDVAADNRAVAKSLRAMAIDWFGQAEANNWSEESGVNQEQLDELAALGYVQPSDGGQTSVIGDCDCEHCLAFED